jgi:hypothetical protein
MCLSWLCLSRTPISTNCFSETLQAWYTSLFYCLGQRTYNVVDRKICPLEDGLECAFAASDSIQPNYDRTGNVREAHGARTERRYQ